MLNPTVDITKYNTRSHNNTGLNRQRFLLPLEVDNVIGKTTTKYYREKYFKPEVIKLAKELGLTNNSKVTNVELATFIFSRYRHIHPNKIQQQKVATPSSENEKSHLYEEIVTVLLYEATPD